MATLTHELWANDEGYDTFCLAGPMGDCARGLLEPGSRLVWTVEADSHFEAMTKYYEFAGRGIYTTDQESDFQPYPHGWADLQRNARLSSACVELQHPSDGAENDGRR